VKERPTMQHNLKTWPEYFDAVAIGAKTFEVRKHDRDYVVGDWLRLMEYDPETERFTGREAMRRVTYILSGHLLHIGIRRGYCVMGLAS
jgi:hypothetical protein